MFPLAILNAIRHPIMAQSSVTPCQQLKKLKLKMIFVGHIMTRLQHITGIAVTKAYFQFF
jgi:hypothetical protein